jgi:riboflavin biosynthesis pyrimidine reductase
MQPVPSATFEPDIPRFLGALDTTAPLAVAVMVTSVDGRATIDGHVGDLTGPADQLVLLGARERARAVLVGSATVRVEGYDRLLDEAARERRRERGLAPEPELVIFGRDSPSPAELIRALRGRHPAGPIVCEGGPSLLGLLVEQRQLDQLVLCLSPRIVGDETQKRLIEHADLLDIPLELLAATSSEGFLFLRYGLR